MSQPLSSPPNPRRLVAALMLGSVLGGGGVLWALSGQSLAAPLSSAPVTPQAGFAPLVQKVKPAVVEIATISQGAVRDSSDSDDDAPQMQQMPDMQGPMGDMLRRYFGQQGRGNNAARPEQRALGSGFIIDPAGYIVTNNHVVDGAREVSVTLTDGAKYKAKVI